MISESTSITLLEIKHWTRLVNVLAILANKYLSQKQSSKIYRLQNQKISVLLIHLISQKTTVKAELTQ
jgi:hypothetical protein